MGGYCFYCCLCCGEVDFVCADVEVGEVLGLYWFFFGCYDFFEGWVLWLVDLVGDVHDGG